MQSTISLLKYDYLLIRLSTLEIFQTSLPLLVSFWIAKRKKREFSKGQRGKNSFIESNDWSWLALNACTGKREDVNIGSTMPEPFTHFIRGRCKLLASCYLTRWHHLPSYAWSGYNPQKCLDHCRKFDGTTGGAGVNDFRPLTAPGGFGPDTQPVNQIRRMGSPPPDQGAFR